MKKYISLFAQLFSYLTILLGTCTLVSCNKIDDPDKSINIAGTWLGSHIADDAQRVVRFEENKSTANYVTSYFNPDYSKEELEVPFTFDKRAGDVIMNFSGIQNASGISQIVLHSIEQEDDIMAGLIHYSEKSHKPDTLLLSRMAESFEAENVPEIIENHLNRDMGPRNPSEEMPKMDWENPFNQPLSVNGEDNVAAGAILAWVGTKIGTAAVSTLASQLFNKLWDEILPGSSSTSANIKQIVKDLQKIKEQLDEINRKLDELLQQHRLAVVTSNFTARNKTYYQLGTSVNTIVRLIEAEKQSADSVASERIKKAIIEWGNSSVEGNQAYNAAENYVKTAMSAYGFQSYPELYDEFAYETIAWECDGYEWREMLRTTDEALVSVTSALTVMYWAARFANKEISADSLQEQIDNQVALLQKMNKVYVDHAVERHPDKMICQIYGFHMVFNRSVEWRHLHFPGWYPSSDTFDLNPEYLVFGNDGGLYRDRFLTEDEYNTLMKYYSNEKGSLLSILKKIGFDIDSVSPDATNAKMLLPNGAVRDDFLKRSWSDLFDIIIKKVINNNKTVEKNVYVGEVYAPRKLIFDWQHGRYAYYIYIFNKYTKFSDYLWFNLEVQQRLK